MSIRYAMWDWFMPNGGFDTEIVHINMNEYRIYALPSSFQYVHKSLIK